MRNPTLEKRHFTLIARIMETVREELKSTYNDHGVYVFDTMIAPTVTQELSYTNPKFDADRFMLACGVASLATREYEKQNKEFKVMEALK